MKIDQDNLSQLKGCFLIDEETEDTLFCYDASDTLYTFSFKWWEKFREIEDAAELEKYKVLDEEEGPYLFGCQHSSLSWEYLDEIWTCGCDEVSKTEFNELFMKIRNLLS